MKDMKKLIFAFGALIAISMFSCTGDNKPLNNEDGPDSIGPVLDSAKVVTGVAIDGANNSISLLVGEDTVSFEYPDLDRDHKDSWYINDTVTVRYYVTQEGDSVTDVINETSA